MDNLIKLSQERQAILESAKEAFFNSGKQVTRTKSAELNPLPAERSTRIDPDTILKRRRKSPTLSERRTLRKMADSL